MSHQGYSSATGTVAVGDDRSRQHAHQRLQRHGGIAECQQRRVHLAQQTDIVRSAEGDVDDARRSVRRRSPAGAISTW